MITFKYPIPCRTFLENGGNIMQSTIVTSNGPGPGYGVSRRDGNVLFITPLDSGGEETRCHIDLCWVLANVLIN